MKRLFAACILFMILGSASFAQKSDEKQFKRIAIDGGAGLSFGIMDDRYSDNEAENGLAGIATFLATLRGVLYGNVRYNVNEYLSVGGRVGIYAITYESGDDSTTLIDIPIHGFVKAAYGSIALEAFGGYYASMIKTPDFNFSGLEAGAKLILGPVYGSYSVVLADPQYNRIELGIQLTEVLGF